MAEDLDVTAALAYETYRTACLGTVAGGVPMPMWEHVSVPEQDAWRQVASAVTGVPLPVPDQSQGAQASPTLWTQEDLAMLTVSDLREMATLEHLSVPSAATKQHLIDALLAHQAGQAAP